jgi:hypothetical protein
MIHLHHNAKDKHMHANWKQLLLVAAIVSPAAALANESVIKERSNHATNKKAIAMEVKEDKVIGSEVRNWDSIDVNKDHAISPEEMQNFLNGIWSAKGKG